MNKYFSFEGRIRRSEFVFSYVIFIALYFLIISYASENRNNSILLILIVPLLWFFLAQSVKRCHDRGNPGYYIFIPFYFLWMVFADSEPGENEYGPCPKDMDNDNSDDDDSELNSREINKHLVD